MPIDYSKYHPEWKTRIRPEILKRAGNKCEFCGLENYSIGIRHKDGFFVAIEKSHQGDVDAEDFIELGYRVIKIVLTIAHLDHDINNNDPDNLRALCQKCHLTLDKDLHKANRARTRAEKLGKINMFGGDQ